MLYKPTPSPINEPVNEPVLYEEVNELKSFLILPLSVSKLSNLPSMSNVVVAIELLKISIEDVRELLTYFNL
jgi:hypothetical protein